MMDVDLIVKEVRENGFTVVKNAFSREKIDQINECIEKLSAKSLEGVILEKDGKSVRAIHGLHLNDPFFKKLFCDKTLLDITQTFLNSGCYVHQSKLNFKKAMTGDAWPWHQDFIFWKNGDGIELPKLLNVAILLSDVEMLHGPLCFIPKSHNFGNLCELHINNGSWESDLSNNLSYQIKGDVLKPFIKKNGVSFITGSAGDVVLFDSLVAHSSAGNLSPFDRPILIITYNSVFNFPQRTEGKCRPEFLCAHDTRPLKALS